MGDQELTEAIRTILDRLGLDHDALTHLHNGREERLTDIGGRVISELL